MSDLTHADLARQLGRLEGEVAGLKDDMATVKADLRTMVDALAQAKGGWKVIAAVASIGGFVGGLAFKASGLFKALGG